MALDSTATTAASEEIVLLDPELRARVGSRAGSRSRVTKNKITTDGKISPRLRWQDWGSDRYWERFLGGVKGDGRGNDEVYFDNFGDPYPPTHQHFLTLTAAVKVIIVPVSAIATPILPP